MRLEQFFLWYVRLLAYSIVDLLELFGRLQEGMNDFRKELPDPPVLVVAHLMDEPVVVDVTLKGIPIVRNHHLLQYCEAGSPLGNVLKHSRVLLELSSDRSVDKCH